MAILPGARLDWGNGMDRVINPTPTRPTLADHEIDISGRTGIWY